MDSGKNYKGANLLSGSIYRVQCYYDTDATYDIEYICEAYPEAELDDFAWRVKRVRYVTATNNLYDTCWAVNDIDANANDYNKGSANFIFKATDSAYVAGLTFNDA